MTNEPAMTGDGTPFLDRLEVTGADRRTLEAIFRHPSSHNLEWMHVVALMKTLGQVEEKHNGQFAFTVGDQHHAMHKPDTKDLEGAEIVELRQFLMRAERSPKALGKSAEALRPAAPDLMIIMDHHGARVFHVDMASDDASKHIIKPYDPHHFLHHLVHKDQSRERGQRAPEDPSFYRRIAEAVAAGGRIVVVGHGEGKSNAAHHLTEYLRTHHSETYKRVVREVTADLSSVKDTQLLEIAQQALH